MDLSPFIVAFVAGAAVALAGAFAAAWLLHRPSTGQSPIPSLPQRGRLIAPSVIASPFLRPLL